MISLQPNSVQLTRNPVPPSRRVLAMPRKRISPVSAERVTRFDFGERPLRRINQPSDSSAVVQAASSATMKSDMHSESGAFSRCEAAMVSVQKALARPLEEYYVQ